MPTLTDDAIVIRLSDYSETSQVVAVFGREHGLVRLMAKGTRRGTKKRPAVGIDLLERGDLIFIPSKAHGLATLTEWVQRDSYLGLRRETSTLYHAAYGAEVVGALTAEGDPHPPVFDALVELLADLARLGEQKTARSPEELIVRFQAAFLRAIGLNPQFRSCQGCGRERPSRGQVFFSSTAGGIVCAACRSRFREIVQVPAAIVRSGFSAVDAAAWFSLLDYHLTHLVGRPFETAGPVRAGLGLQEKREPDN